MNGYQTSALLIALGGAVVMWIVVIFSFPGFSAGEKEKKFWARNMIDFTMRTYLLFYVPWAVISLIVVFLEK